MALGDIKFTYSFLKQTMNIDSAVSIGDLLVQGSADDDYDLTPAGENSDPTRVDAIALEDMDESGEGSVFLTGLIEVGESPAAFDTNDWSDVDNATVHNNFQLSTDDENTVIFLR